jgi:4-carboxymuconolactone decarboxylase
MEQSSDKKNPEMPAQVERRDFLGGAAVLAGTSLLGLGLPGSAAAAEVTMDRMPPIPAEKWTEEQKKAAAELVAGPRKNLNGPFIPLLRSPELMSRVQKVGEYLRFNTKLPPILSEFIILINARQWTQSVEWNSHSQDALKAGVKPEILAAIADGRRPTGMSEDHEMLHDFCIELHHNKSVSDATYARVLNKFGEQTTIDVVGFCGYYSMLGMVLNVARTAVPAGKTPQLIPFPH